MKPKRNIFLSDLHCGSDRALFPPSISLPPLMADEKERLLSYSNIQKRLYDHLMKCAYTIRAESEGFDKVFVFNGDIVEGIHHRTIQLSAPMVEDHVLIAEQIIEDFLQAAGFRMGDELHFTSGTEVHTEWNEARVSRKFEYYGAKYHDELKLNQFGKNIWAVHQWVGVGDGANEGSPIINGLKRMYYNSLREKWEMPDVVIGSHFHKASLGSWSQNWKTFYGIVTPSWQFKTRHGQKVAPYQRNDIGLFMMDVSEGGINIHNPMLLEQK